MTGDLLLLLVALFVGQGYLISHPVMQYKILTYVLFGITAAVGYSMSIYETAVPDNPLYAYNLESIPGIIYNVCRGVCAVFFTFCVVHNMRKETYTERRSLYLVLLIIYLAFLVGPVVYFGFSYLQPRWFRESGNYLFSRMLDLVAICIIVYLTNPKSIEDNFRVQTVSGLGPDKAGATGDGAKLHSDVGAGAAPPAQSAAEW